MNLTQFEVDAGALAYYYKETVAAAHAAIDELVRAAENAFPDTEADGCVYCGKCGAGPK